MILGGFAICTVGLSAVPRVADNLYANPICTAGPTSVPGVTYDIVDVRAQPW